MEKLWSVCESIFSKDTCDLIADKFWETEEFVTSLYWPYKVVLVGTGAIIGLYWFFTRPHDHFKKLGIPGPNPGLFGAFADYRSKGLPKFDLELMKKYGKIVGIFHARRPVYMIGDADMIRQITVKEFSAFINRQSKAFPIDPLFKNSVLGAEDDHWKFHRSILSPTFTTGRLKEMSPLIQKCYESLLKNLWRLSEEGTKSMKMRDVFSMYTMDVIASTAFGIEIDCQKDPDNPFLKNAKALITPGKRMWFVVMVCSFFPFLAPVFERFGYRTVDPSCGNFFLTTVQEAIKQRKEGEVRNDFLQLMLKSHQLEEDKEDDGSHSHIAFDKNKRRGLTNEEIVGNALIFIIAGYETTSLTLSYMAYCLATNPEVQDRLIEEIDSNLKGAPPNYDNVSRLQYLENTFLETLRMHPATTRTSRISNRDVTINGVFIPAKSDVHIPMLAIHHDPDYFPEPEKFNPDRFLPENRHKDFNYVYLPFGVGPRNCIGMRLAHIEVRIAIAAILQKYRFKPAPETKIPPELGKMDMKPQDDMVLMIEKR